VPRRNEAISVCCRLATGAGCLIGRRTVSHRFAHLLRVFSVIGVFFLAPEVWLQKHSRLFRSQIVWGVSKKGSPMCPL
jgi:hypothetical protein